MTERQRLRQLQHHWDAVRSQIDAHMARCDVARDEDAVTAAARHIFRVDEAEPYYGPTRGAREAINALLGLDASANQLEWEAEMSDPAKLERLTEALGDHSLDKETRSAIALLLLDVAERLGTERLARIRWHLRRDGEVQARMRYFWTHMHGGAAVMEALS
jgi:hypothetical protein